MIITKGIEYETHKELVPSWIISTLGGQLEQRRRWVRGANICGGWIFKLLFKSRKLIYVIGMIFVIHNVWILSMPAHGSKRAEGVLCLEWCFREMRRRVVGERTRQIFSLATFSGKTFSVK